MYRNWIVFAQLVLTRREYQGPRINLKYKIGGKQLFGSDLNSFLTSRMRHAILMFAVLLVTACSTQKEHADVLLKKHSKTERSKSAHSIEAHLNFLSGDLLEGRETGSRGYDIGAEYVASYFEQSGFEELGDEGTYFQRIAMISTQAVDDQSSVTLLADKFSIPLTPLEDFLPSPSYYSENTSVTAPVVFVGFGVTSPENNYNDYENIDVKGKIVAILAGAPPTFGNDQRAYYASPQVKLENAVARGAEGMLYFFTPEHRQIFPWAAMRENHKNDVDIRWLEENGTVHGAYEQIRGTAVLSEAGATKLFSNSTKGLAKVFADAAAGAPQGFPLSIEATITSASSIRQFESSNVVARLPGSDPQLRQEHIVYSAHLDHIGIGEPVEGDTVFNGAYDNASGVAVLLEISRMFSLLSTPPKRSVIFLAVTGEEKGLRGSDYFVNNPPVPIDKITANINFDSVLMLQAIHDVVAVGAEHSSLGKIARSVFPQHGMAVSPDRFPEQVIFIRSDHFSFVKKGVPALWPIPGFATEDDPMGAFETVSSWYASRYHKRGDDMSAPFYFDAGADFAQANFALGLAIANDPARATWNSGDFFGKLFADDGKGAN